MNANDFFQLRIKKAKEFGFPEPIFINTEKLTEKNRVLYTAEIQATHIPDKEKGKTHHFALKFTKFTHIKTEPHWIEEDVTQKNGFAISDKSSIEKLAAYIKANQALLGIDILSKDFTSVVLSNDTNTINVLKQILSSNKNKNIIYDLFKEHYPELDEKILTYKLVQKRRKALAEFKSSLVDTNKKERNYWHPFLEKNRWMFGLSYVIPLEETRVDINNTPDYLFKSDDGFVDIIEIKHPHYDFWARDRNGNYLKYRNFLQICDELRGGVTQATNYIFQVEKKYSDIDWQRNNQCVPPVKPNCTVVIGRSHTWNEEENTAFRLLNDSLHGVNVITFDHLYDRAERLLKLLESE